MSNIIPIRDLKDTTKISKICHDTDRPVFITKNGYADMVIMSDSAYSRMAACEAYTLPAERQSFAAESVTPYRAVPSYTIPSIKRVLTPILRRHGVLTAVLFGSYAKGEETPDSDIDLVVDCDLRGLAFFGLLEDVSNAFSVPVDLIAGYQVEPGSAAEAEIAEYGIRIFG